MPRGDGTTMRSGNVGDGNIGIGETRPRYVEVAAASAVNGATALSGVRADSARRRGCRQRRFRRAWAQPARRGKFARRASFVAVPSCQAQAERSRQPQHLVVPQREMRV
jgi:hypothetical protein